jgi:hypothetical protein
VGVGRIILLVLDNAGWHGAAGLKIPDSIRLIYLLPYTPELQPVEMGARRRADRQQHIATIEKLEEKIATQCVALTEQRDQIQTRAGFHWWPKRIVPN